MQLKQDSFKKVIKGALVGATMMSFVAPVLTGAAQAQDLTGAGATFPGPIYAKWFDTYRELTNVSINYQAIGSGGGINQLKAGTVDFGASDAPLSDAEASSMPGEVLHVPTVAGAVSVIYNVPGVPKGLRLSGDALADIFQGQITRWDDNRLKLLNPGVSLPGTAIVVAHRSDSSGTSAIFTNYLSSASPEWKSKVGAGKSVDWPTGIGGKGNDGVAAVVKSTRGGIGYVEHAYAINNKLSYAAIKNRAGKFVGPSLSGVTAAAVDGADEMGRDVRVSIVNRGGAGTYPISGFTYILLYKKDLSTAKGKQVVRFLKWAMGPGQGYAKDLNYAPLPKSVVALNLAHLK